MTVPRSGILQNTFGFRCLGQLATRLARWPLGSPELSAEEKHQLTLGDIALSEALGWKPMIFFLKDIYFFLRPGTKKKHWLSLRWTLLPKAWDETYYMLSSNRKYISSRPLQSPLPWRTRGTPCTLRCLTENWSKKASPHSNGRMG